MRFYVFDICLFVNVREITNKIETFTLEVQSLSNPLPKFISFIQKNVWRENQISF